MIEHILKNALEGNRGEFEKYKKNATSKLLQTAKKYWKYLAIGAFIILIAIIGIVWMLWSILAWVTSWLWNEGTDVVKKVEEVGINWIIEEPLQIVRDIWYWKDGK